MVLGNFFLLIKIKRSDVGFFCLFLIKVRICSYCFLVWFFLIRLILFCRIRMCFSFMIFIVVRCLEVWGWGYDLFLVIEKEFKINKLYMLFI